MIPSHLLHYCRGAGKVPVASNIIYHDRHNPFTVLRYSTSIIVSFLSAVLIIKAIYTIQKSYVNTDSDTVIMLHTSPDPATDEKKIKPVAPESRATKAKPEVKPKPQTETVRQPEKTTVPAPLPVPVINKPKRSPDVPLQQIDMAARKQWRSTVTAQDRMEMASLIKKPEIRAASSVTSSARKTEKNTLFNSRKAVSHAPVPTPKVSREAVTSYKLNRLSADVPKRSGLFSSNAHPAETKTQLQTPGVYSPPNTSEEPKAAGFIPADIPKGSPTFSVGERTVNKNINIAGINTPARTLSSKNNPDIQTEVKKTTSFKIKFNEPQENDPEHIIEGPDISVPDADGNYETMNPDEKKVSVYEGLLPGAAAEPEDDLTVKGVPLSKLPACRNAREETALTEQILNVIGSRHMCSDSTNRYLFSGTQRLSSFGMMIQPIVESRLSDRCGELHKAYQCLSVKRN
jgi:hypothetical protein